LHEVIRQRQEYWSDSLQQIGNEFVTHPVPQRRKYGITRPGEAASWNRSRQL